MLSKKVILLSVILSLWLFDLDSASVTLYSDWGDVIDVNYSLWEDKEHNNPVEGNINKDLRYIYLRKSQQEKVPSEVVSNFPISANSSLQQLYLQQFINALTGMQVNQEKEFMISRENHNYGDFDLYYRVKLLAILYDASAHVTEEKNTTDPFKDFYPLLIGGSVIIIGGGLGVWYIHASRISRSALSEEKMSSTVRAKSIQKDKDKIKELREITESFTDSEDIVKKKEVKFRSRRR